ncbi:hypothetical protein [Dinghuibacter silviterrae]|nr:hypothetical protein [Dinghuibacter silviterrae]
MPTLAGAQVVDTARRDTIPPAVDTGRQITAAYVDSLMSDDSLMKDLSAFIDSLSRPKTLLAIELGVGNGFFTTKSATAATGYTTKTFLNPSVSYLHKSGFGISAAAYATEDQGMWTVYQGAITPSFDIGRRHWAAGISYTRYFNKDSISFGVSPLRNDVYLYGVFKKYWLEPGLAFDWTFDMYQLETIIQPTAYPPNNRLDTFANNIYAHVFAGIFTLQHDFEWFGLFNKNDHFAFTPTLMTLADASNYNISVSRVQKDGGKSKSKLQALREPKQTTPVTFESISALLNGVYTYKHFLISPQVLATYFLNASTGVQPFRVSYLFNIGLVF